MRHACTLSVTGVAVLGSVLLAACSSPAGQAPATSVNTVDTVTLYALDDGHTQTPSGYTIIGRRVVQTTTTTAFDFAFNLYTFGPDSVNVPAFLPAGVLRLGQVPGFQKTGGPFSAIITAPSDGYVLDKPYPLTVGTLGLARSRRQTCADGTVTYLYAKFHILAIDPVAQTVRFEILANQNCGYMGLDVGIPSK
jgi:hypothetical protein